MAMAFWCKKGGTSDFMGGFWYRQDYTQHIVTTGITVLRRDWVVVRSLFGIATLRRCF